MELKLPKASIAARIQHLDVKLYDCYAHDSVEATLLDACSAWRWLLRPNDNVHSERPEKQIHVIPSQKTRLSEGTTPTDWQKSLPKLKTLQVTLYGCSKNLTCSRKGPEHMEVYEKLLGSTEIPLKADKISINVTVRDYNHGLEPYE